MRATSEWAAGLVSLPSYVMDGSRDPYRPSVFLCVDVASGFVLCADIVDPDEAFATAGQRCLALFREARDRMPTTLRVATLELATALRDAALAVEVVVADTPEIAHVFDSFLEHTARTGGGPESYLGPGVDAPTIETLFESAARLYQAQPWAKIPPDACVQVDCPALQIERGLLVVVGQMGQSFGFAIFPDQEAFAALQALGATGVGVAPAQIMFNFDSRDELPRALIDEVRSHRWKLAGPAAYPSVMRLDGQGGARPLTAPELAAVAAVANALATLVSRAPQLHHAWRGLPPITQADAGTTLTAPAPLPTLRAHAPREPALADLVRRPLTRDGALDQNACDTYVEVIEAAFLRSPEARDVAPEWARVFLEDGALVLGTTIAQLVPDEVRDLVFGELPRSLIAQPSDAPAIIATIQAILEFAARELGSYAANWSATTALPGDAVDTLASELADPNNYGPAKAFFMQGLAAGYDMSTQGGVDAWTRAHNRDARAKAPAKRSTPRASPRSSKKPKPTKRSSPRKPRKPTR
ncbi:MAG: hypothetical protein ABJE66_35895 [Deltaproteobacteria bacterium]